MRTWQICLSAIALVLATVGIGVAFAISTPAHHAALVPPHRATQASRIGLGDFTTLQGGATRVNRMGLGDFTTLQSGATHVSQMGLGDFTVQPH